MKTAPSKFRKKPVTVEAMRFDGTTAETMEVYRWIEENTAGSFDPMHQIMGFKPWPESGVAIDPRDGRLIIATLEGAHWADVGDWIICGVAGEFYPCKPDIFDATYEEVQS